MTLAILSWKAHKTLVNTLQSYRKYGLDQTDHERIIFFQEIDEEDIRIAKEYGYDYIGSPENVGIAEGYKRLVEASTSDLFLFLENDWELIEPVSPHLYQASELLRAEEIDVARLRHRKNPGNPLWTRQFEGRELSRPEHLLDSIHWTNPSQFVQIERYDPEAYANWYTAYAKNANWTNNPTMFRTNWLREYIVPRLGYNDIERDIQHWWQRQWFLVGQGDGLFTHNRLD